MQLITIFEVFPSPSAEALGKIMAKWIELSNNVQDAAGFRLPPNSTLEWKMVFKPKSHRTGWTINNGVRGDCSVALTIPVNILMEKGGAKASVPLTLVQEIIIDDDGRLFWHKWCDGEKTKLPLDIAEALVTGKCNGRNYQHNHFPPLALAQEV